MRERERTVVTGLVVLMSLLWLGFLVHRSPRFPGSLWGGVLGLGGALLMLAPLAYLCVKRLTPLRTAVTRRVSMRTLLSWHIYAGILGPILALLHTGHQFHSPLGIALTAMMLTVAVSGFVGRYLMTQLSQEIREKQIMLADLEAQYQRTANELTQHPCCAPAFRPVASIIPRLLTSLFVPSVGGARDVAMTLSARAVQLAGSIADVEYAVKTHELAKRMFAWWLPLHIVLSAIFYVLLALHVWAGIHFGLRWFA
jgi:hypothetical protein